MGGRFRAPGSSYPGDCADGTSERIEGSGEALRLVIMKSVSCICDLAYLKLWIEMSEIFCHKG